MVAHRIHEIILEFLGRRRPAIMIQLFGPGFGPMGRGSAQRAGVRTSRLVQAAPGRYVAILGSPLPRSFLCFPQGAAGNLPDAAATEDCQVGCV